MRIDYNNLIARVSGQPSEEKWIDRYLTFDTPATPYTGRSLQLYSRYTGTFPTGLLTLVQKAAQEENIAIHNIVDNRPPHIEPDMNTDISWLRDYQKEAVAAAIKRERGILHHPTGSGKSECAIAIIKMIPCKWLFLTHRTLLAQQFGERYRLRVPGQTYGMIGDNTWIEHDTLTCATFQTLYADIAVTKSRHAAKFLNTIEGIIVDEAHVAPAKSFYKIIMSTPHAYWRFALSGTPLVRGDKKSVYLIGAIGPVVHRIKPDVLITAGAIARPKIYMQISNEPIRLIDPTNYHEIYKKGITHSAQRNTFIVRDIKQAKKPCLVFVRHIEHGRIIQAALRAQKIASQFIHGQHNTYTRQSAINKTAYGDIDVLIASVIMREGVDIPEAMSVVNAAGGKSVIDQLQKIGRGMRATDSSGNLIKTDFEVYDYQDIGNRVLSRQSLLRIRTYQKEGYEIVQQKPTATHHV